MESVTSNSILNSKIKSCLLYTCAVWIVFTYHCDGKEKNAISTFIQENGKFQGHILTRIYLAAIFSVALLAQSWTTTGEQLPLQFSLLRIASYKNN